MKEFKGTPGTWWASGREVGDFPMMNNKVALVDGESYEAVIANARLIAAAPDLLKALIAVRDGAKGDSPEMWAMVDAAIAKALGESK